MNFGNFGNRASSHIFFSRAKAKSEKKGITNQPSQFRFGTSSANKLKSQSLFLLSSTYNFNVLEYIPKLFTITTNTGSANFNTYLLKDTSSVIAQLLNDNPQSLEYHLDISDTDNVLKKFEQMYQGEFITFEEDELLISHKITRSLNLINCPNFMKPESLKSPEPGSFSINSRQNSIFGVEMDFNRLNSYLQNEAPRSFTIATNKKEYMCNIFGVYSSNVIRQLLTEDPSIDKFNFDYDDEFDQFQSICDFFNFESVVLTKNNMDSIKEIADELQITIIFDDVEKFINTSEEVSKSIDDQQEIVKTNEDIFSLLYSIKDKTVEAVKKGIIESKWCQTEDNVKELAAFIIQVARTDFIYHQYLIDLILQLDQEADDQNQLKILKPYIAKQHMMMSFDPPRPISTFGSKIGISTGSTFSSKLSSLNSYSMADYGFIYSMYKRGIIAQETLYAQLKDARLKNSFLKAWFFPELNQFQENKPTSSFSLSKGGPATGGTFGSPATGGTFGSSATGGAFGSSATVQVDLFIRSFPPERIDIYKKLRDSGEPDDELTKALRRDDVDTVQKIITSSGETDFSKAFVPFNIFENYVPNGKTRYINYAAAYGSLNCFKYFLSNHDKIDKSTFSFAVYGGNHEIIRIVDQNEQNGDLDNDKDKKPKTGFSFGKSPQLTSITDKIIPAIMKHQNDVFDWIIDSKLTEKQTNDNLSSLINCSVANGNAHSLIEIIDRGFNLSNNKSEALSALQLAAQNGFYMLTQLIVNLIGEKMPEVFSFNTTMLNFDNVSILNLFIDKLGQRELDGALRLAVCNDFESITKVFFENLVKEKYKLTEMTSFSLLRDALDRNKNKFVTFYYLVDRIKEVDPKILNNIPRLNSLLATACETKNTKAAELITDLIIDNKDSLSGFMDDSFDFTQNFINAASSESTEICKYFIEKKTPINYEKLSAQVSELGSLNEELFSIIISNVSPEAKERIVGCFDQAIEKKNKDLVKYLIKENPPFDHALLLAVCSHDLELVEIILEHDSQPSYINKLCDYGTALSVAVENGDLQIVKKLLSLPGINPSLYSHQNATPLTTAICRCDLEITNAILDFYGDDIQDQRWQINEALTKIFDDSPRSGFSFGKRKENENEKEEKKKKIVTILLRILEIKSINPNLHFNNKTLLTYACQNNSIELVQSLLKYDNIDLNLYEPVCGDSPLIVAVKNNNYDIAKLLIEHPKTNINQRNYSENTALTIATINSYDKIIDLLVKSDKFDPKESCLDYAFFISSGEISKQLLPLKSLDVNFMFVPFILNINKKPSEFGGSKFSFGNKTTPSKFGFNKPNEPNPNNNNNNNGNPDENDKPKFKFSFGTGNASKFSPQNRSRKSKMNETTLLNAVNLDDIAKIDLIVQHPSFDIVKSQLKTAISISLSKNKLLIFRKLIKFVGDDVNIVDYNGKSLLHYSALNLSNEIVHEILSNPNFDSKKSDILEAFIQSYTAIHERPPSRRPVENPNDNENNNNNNNNNDDDARNNEKNNEKNNDGDGENKEENSKEFEDENGDDDENDLSSKSPIPIMKELYNYDKEHDHLIDFTKLLPNGLSFFTVINHESQFDEEIANFLLENGVDPNEPDKNGIYPLQRAISIFNSGVASALIDSGKVDLTKQIQLTENYSFGFGPAERQRFLGDKYTTYLHIAASIEDPLMLTLFLDRKLIDVNIANDLGETPLMTACRYRRKQNIQILFNNDDLNFLYLNNEGNDALQIVGKPSTTKDKNEYLQLLLEATDDDGHKFTFRRPGSNDDDENNQGKSENNKTVTTTTTTTSKFGTANKTSAFGNKAASSGFSFGKPKNESESTSQEASDSANKANESGAKPTGFTFNKPNSGLTSAAPKFGAFGGNAKGGFSFGKPKGDSPSTASEAPDAANKPAAFAFNKANNESDSAAPKFGAFGKTTGFAFNKSNNESSQAVSALKARSFGSAEAKSKPQKLEFHHESFSESPDPSFNAKRKLGSPARGRARQGIESEIEDAVGEVIEGEDPRKVRQLSKSISRLASRKVKKLADMLDEEDSGYGNQGGQFMHNPQYAYDQNAMVIQLQNQWLQMIQMNNANQARLTMQMMQQNKVLQQQQKRKKKKSQKENI